MQLSGCHCWRCLQARVLTSLQVSEHPMLHITRSSERSASSSKQRNGQVSGSRQNSPAFRAVAPQLITLAFLEYARERWSRRRERVVFPKVAPGTTGKSGFSKWFGRYIGAHGITDSSKVFHSFRHSFVDALRLAGVGGEINIALLGHTDPSVHDKYGAKDKAIRFRHRLGEAVASVAYAGLDLSH